MKLNKSSDYALRLLIYLAAHEGSITMPVLATELGIPYNHLSKLIQQLSKAELIHTRQGKNGGVKLLRAPEDISMKNVLEIVEGPIRLTDCLISASETDCKFVCHCKLKETFSVLQKKIDSMFEQVKIAQMI